MGKIIQLDTHLSNMIAAGEVVENMASVIKELMENSIDAQAQSIQVHLFEYGLKSIQVIDDGEGMDALDLKMAFNRHATSKIKAAHDLYRIQSLGFRGEALPSIASVSKVTIESSQSDAPGQRLIIENNTILEKTIGAPRKGTSILVEKLFYNTPARLKHLKSEHKELSAIIDYVNKMALSHPNIRFLLTHDSKPLFQTSGDLNILKILNQIYPLEIIKNMVSFTNQNQYFKITGYLTKPAYTRSTRNHISLFINQRIVKNNALMQAVNLGYDTYLPKQKYPIVYMNIDVDPLFIDVNIHPQKLEVKLTEQKNLEQLIITTIKSHLEKEDLIPNVKKEVTQPIEYPSLDLQTTQDSSEPLTYEDVKVEETTVQLPKKLPYLEYIGQYEGTYLLFQSDEGLFLIDQHAAAERIRYERYLESMKAESKTRQALMVPLTLPLSNQEVIALKSSQAMIEDFGLKIDFNDDGRLNIYEIPSWFKNQDVETYAEHMVRQILTEDTISQVKLVDQLAKDLACKHSIKANKYLTKAEVHKLLNDLNQTNNPYTCPHGRPTIIKFTRTEIEKLFKRIV